MMPAFPHILQIFVFFALYQSQEAYVGRIRLHRFNNCDIGLNSLSDLVRDAFSDEDKSANFAPYLVCNDTGVGVFLDDDVVLSTDLYSVRGADKYGEITTAFRRTLLPQLSDGKCSMTQLSQQGENTVLLRWNVTFIPDSIFPLVILGNILPFVRVSYFDVLHLERVRSTFSWERLLQFAQLILQKGEMRLPNAVIQGSTILQFRPIYEEQNYSETELRQRAALRPQAQSMEQRPRQSAGVGFVRDGTVSLTNENFQNPTTVAEERTVGNANLSVHHWQLISHKESLQLVRSLNSGVLQNRKLAYDLLQYLDCARPAFFGIDAWNDLLAEKLAYSSVPGMKQFDIDGIDPAESQGSVVLATVRRLPFVFMVALIVVGAFYATLSSVYPLHPDIQYIQEDFM